MNLDFLWRHLEYVQNQIERADGKMNLLLVVHLALVPFAATLIYHVVLREPECLLRVPFCCLFLVFVLFALAFFWFEWKFVQLFRKAVSPRVDAQKYLGREYKSIVFWNHIADRQKFRDFKSFEESYRKEQLEEDLLEQIYVNSHIAREKFECVQKAYRNLKHSVLFLLFMGISALAFLLICQISKPQAGL